MELSEKFNNIPISRLVLKLGLPAMFAQIVNILYTIVDRIFVGMTDGGTLALAAVGICGPLITSLTGFAFMTGTGGSAIFSISLGEERPEKASRTLYNSFLLTVVISLIITIVVLIIKEPLLYFLGSNKEMYSYADAYLSVYILGTLASLVGLAMNQFILAQGYARTGMFAVVMGAVINIILDPLMIFGFGLGIAGAAWATIISQYIVMAFVLYFLIFKATPIKLRVKELSFKLSRRIISIGSMPLLITFLDNFIIMALNMQLRKYGGNMGNTYLASATIISSFMSISVCLAGITQGCATLFGFHYGAGNWHKVLETFWNVFKVCLVYMLLLTVISQVFPQFFVSLFTKDPRQIELTSVFLRMYTVGIVGVGVQYTIVDGLVAMGEVGYSIPCSLIRKFIYLFCLYFLPVVLPIEDIFWAGTISDVLGAGISILIFFSFVLPRLKVKMSNKNAN